MWTAFFVSTMLSEGQKKTRIIRGNPGMSIWRGAQGREYRSTRVQYSGRG
ncbi:hypothetical protein BH10BAC6_BH10BAC6_09260 [soil metagenome]